MIPGREHPAGGGQPRVRVLPQRPWRHLPVWLVLAAVLLAGLLAGMAVRQPDVDACRLAAAHYRDYVIFRLGDLADRVPVDRVREGELLARGQLRYERCNRAAWLP